MRGPLGAFRVRGFMAYRFSTAIAVVFLASLTAACPQGYRVQLKPGSTASALTLVLGDKHPRPVDMVEISTCGRVDSGLTYKEGQPVWSAQGWDLPDSIRRYREITYGQRLTGFAERVTSTRLASGCYVATVVAGGSGTLHLWIDSLGAVHQWTQRDHDSASAQYNKYAALSNARADSAITLCLAAYHSAPTAADSATIDRQVMNERVGLEPFTCRDYRRLYWSRFQKRPWSEDSTGGGA